MTFFVFFFRLISTWATNLYLSISPCERVEIKHQAFLTSVLDGGQLLASSSNYFSQHEMTLGLPWIRLWDDGRRDKDAVLSLESLVLFVLLCSTLSFTKLHQKMNLEERTVRTVSNTNAEECCLWKTWQACRERQVLWFWDADLW